MKGASLPARALFGCVVSLLVAGPLSGQALPVAAGRPERMLASHPSVRPPATATRPERDATDLPPYLLPSDPYSGVSLPAAPRATTDPGRSAAGADIVDVSSQAAGSAAGKIAAASPAKGDLAPPAAASRPLPPKQGVAGPEVFSVNVPMNPLIRQYLDIYTSPSGLRWLRLVLERAEPFRGYIASRIQHYHMPPELLYLPIVESTYNTYAVSQSGAAGLWQFMSNSVYPFGLRINEWMDERFDFWKATDASLEKLKYNYEQLGSWLLALAAYNVGLNYVTEVVRRTGIRNVWELGAKGYLPYETMVYIPKFLAIAAVCSYPGRYGLPIDWRPPLRWARIELHQAVDLRILARDAGIDESLLLEGNAELRYDITPPGDTGYYLKVPQRDSKVVERVLRERKYHLMRFYIYTVESGDTLYDLSLYYGVPVSMILQYNPSVSARYLQIGQRLVIPGVRDVAPYPHGTAAAIPKLGPTITLHDPTGRFTGLYTVRPGDTLWAISRRYGITPAELARVNGITESTIITDGTVLHVPGPGALIIEGAN